MPILLSTTIYCQKVFKMSKNKSLVMPLCIALLSACGSGTSNQTTTQQMNGSLVINHFDNGADLVIDQGFSKVVAGETVTRSISLVNNKSMQLTLESAIIKQIGVSNDKSLPSGLIVNHDCVVSSSKSCKVKLNIPKTAAKNARYEIYFSYKIVSPNKHQNAKSNDISLVPATAQVITFPIFAVASSDGIIYFSDESSPSNWKNSNECFANIVNTVSPAYYNSIIYANTNGSPTYLAGGNLMISTNQPYTNVENYEVNCNQATNSYSALAYNPNNNLFAAVGGGLRESAEYDVYISSVTVNNGNINVTPTTGTPSNATFTSVAAGENGFVAGGLNGVLYYSYNGLNWYPSNNNTTHNINSVIYSNGNYYSVSDDAIVFYSTDNGINWLDANGTEDQHGNFYSIAANNESPNYMVATGISGGNAANSIIYTSSDNGISWSGGVFKACDNLISVTYGNGVFVAVGNSGSNGCIAYSNNNGISWNYQNNQYSGLNSVAYSNGYFVAAGNNGTIIASSNGGVSWWDAANIGVVGNLISVGTIGNN